MQGLIFDLDGTLIDSRRDLATAINLVRDNYGLVPLELEAVVAMVGDGVTRLLKRALVEKPEVVTEAVELMKHFYSQNLLEQTLLYDNVAVTLKRLHERGVPMAVFTNKRTDASRIILRGLGVEKYFQMIVGDGEGFPLKPNPEVIWRILDVFEDRDARQSWMIGDHHTDMAAAQAAGVRGALAGWGFGRLEGQGCDCVLSDFSEVLTLPGIGK